MVKCIESVLISESPMNYIFVSISSAITILDNLQTVIKTKALVCRLTHRSPEIQI